MTASIWRDRLLERWEARADTEGYHLYMGTVGTGTTTPTNLVDGLVLAGTASRTVADDLLVRTGGSSGNERRTCDGSSGLAACTCPAGYDDQNGDGTVFPSKFAIVPSG